MVLYKSLGRKGGVSTRLQKTSEDHLFHAAPVVQHWAKVHVVHCPISRLLRKTTRPKWGWKFIGHPKPFRRDISGLFVLDWRHHPAIFLQQLCTECTWCACENAPSVRVWRALHNLFFFFPSLSASDTLFRASLTFICCQRHPWLPNTTWRIHCFSAALV